MADRERSDPGQRPRAASGRQAHLVEGQDDLWPPFSVPASDRDARAHRKVHEYAEQPPRGRGRNRLLPALSRAEIVDAAIAVADAEGADAVSMRRIAQVLRAGPMSLYWHVANKEHLLELMLDVLFAEAEVPDPTGDWRADLQAHARSHRAMLHRHEWAIKFMGGRPPLGPGTMLNMEHSLAILDGSGLDMATSMRVLETVVTYVLGAVLRETGEIRGQREQETAGVTMEEWEPLRAAWRDRLAADGRFARVVRFLDERIDPDAEQTRDERFEFGLNCVLDGLAALLPAPKTPRAQA